MKNGIKLLLFDLMMMLVAASCREDFVIEVEEGEHMIGVEAYFSDEMKQHEIILSYTADFYNTGEIQMISGATVFVTDGVDTIPCIESQENKGHYFTDMVAGKKNTVYRLCIAVTEADGEVTQLSSECLIPDNVERIDSLVVKPFNGTNDSIPTVLFGDTIEWVYPYFQSLPNPDIVYLPIIYKNDTIINDTLLQQLTMPVGGYAGYYINGPEMQAANKEIPVYYFKKSNLKDGDRIRLDLRSIQPEYMYFYYNVFMSTGSNPMMGAPANVNTNIYPTEKAVGWFLTASSVTVETTFIDNHFNSRP
jgi:hypothetical protein